MNIKTLILLGASLIFSSVLYADEVEVIEDKSRAHIKAKHHEEGNLYIVAKALMDTGHTITEEATEEEHAHELHGEIGGGIGVDLGYRLGYGFATEFDFTFAHNSVKKSMIGEEDVSAGADYFTYGLDLLYGYHVSEAFVVFAKVGWEIEHEKIADFDIENTSSGFCYAVGVEYGFTEHWAYIGEFESAVIESTRGNSIMTGLSYIF